MVPQGYYDYAKARESGGDPNATNPNSSASGLYQFTDGTWADLMSRHPELGLTSDGRMDPKQQEAAMPAFTNDNASALYGAGHEPTKDNLYLAHRFGASGAIKALGSDPNATAASVFGDKVMQANPDLQGKTIADLTGSTPMQMAARGGTQTTIPAQRYVQGNAPTPAALSADGVLGNGLLSGDLSSSLNGIERAGIYLQGISKPEALGALANVGPKPGRYTQTVDNDRGVIRVTDGQTGRVTETPIRGFKSPEVRAAEKKSAEDWVGKDDAIAKGAADATDALGKLNTLRQALKDPSIYTGPGGSMTDTFRRTLASAGLGQYSGMGKADLIKALTSEELGIARQTNGVQRMTNAEIPVLSLQTAGLNQSPEGNERIIQSHERVLKLGQSVNEAAQQYRNEHDGLLDRGFQPIMDQVRQQHAAMWKREDATMAQPAASGKDRPPLSSFEK